MSPIRLSFVGCIVGAAAWSGAQTIPRFTIPVEAFHKVQRKPATVNRHRGLMPRINRSVSAPQTVPTQVKGTEAAVQTDAEADSEKEKRKNSLTDWFSANVLRRMEVSGNRQFGYHRYTVSGDFDAYSSLNYYGQGGNTFTDTGNLNLSGKNVLGFLNFDVAFTDSHYNDPDSHHVTLTYDKGPIRMSVGDIRGTLTNTNEFASYRKTLSGAMAEYQTGRVTIKALRSENKGEARTVSLQGNNSTGPYYLQSGRVIPDTVSVQVDGQAMKLLTDYVVNTDIGMITFVDRVISPASTIIVTYESYGSSSSLGTVQGAGLTYELGRYGRVGMTGIESKTGLTGAGNSTVQRFYGYGSAAAQYWLDYEPIPGSVQIKVDGILQVEGSATAPGGDYYFDTSSAFVFYFKRAIPTTQQIDVTYRPLNTQSTAGDRSVWGWDYRLPFGKTALDGYLQYSEATGRRTSETNPSSGRARGIDGRYKLGSLDLRATFKDIPSSYVTVESSSFQRNERSGDLGLDWHLGRYTYTADWSNSSVTSQTTSGTTVTNTLSRLTSASVGASYRDLGGMTWNLTQTRKLNRTDNDTRLDTTSVSGTKRYGRVDTTFGVDHQTGRGLISDGDTSKMGNVALETYRVGAKYQLDSGFAIDSRASISSVKTSYKSGVGNDYSLGMAYRPAGKFSASASYAQSDSGEVATLGGFSDGSGTGYDGNGFSSGSSGSGSYGSGGTNVQQANFSLEYQATKRAHLVAQVTNSDSQGSLSSNSKSLTYDLGLDYDLGNFNLLTLQLDQTHTDFISDVASQSASTSVSAYLTGSPKGPWYYRLGLSTFLSSGTSSYQQNSYNYDAMVGIRVAPRQSLSFTLRDGTTSGLYGQKDRAMYLQYGYDLVRGISLVGSWKFRDVSNVDSSTTSGAYTSSGFDLELAMNFGR